MGAIAVSIESISHKNKSIEFYETETRRAIKASSISSPSNPPRMDARNVGGQDYASSLRLNLDGQRSMVPLIESLSRLPDVFQFTATSTLKMDSPTLIEAGFFLPKRFNWL
jgi:hypothetical protein